MRHATAIGAVWLVLLCICSFAQNATADKDGEKLADSLVKWDTICEAKGCLMQTDVLRGISDDAEPPDSKDVREYIGLDVAIDRKTKSPAYFSFLVDPRAQRDQGVFITFTKSVFKDGKWDLQPDPDGPVRIPILDCHPDYCAARVPLGVTQEGKDSRKEDLLDRFLNSSHLLVLYVRDGKTYRTMVILSSFKKEYARVMATELKESSATK